MVNNIIYPNDDDDNKFKGNNPIALFYHREDNDGHLACLGVLYYISTVKNIDLKYIDLIPYNYEFLDFEKYTKQYNLLIFVDSSPVPLDSAFSYLSKQSECNVLVIDHHVKVKEETAKLGISCVSGDTKDINLDGMFNLNNKDGRLFYYCEEEYSAAVNVWKVSFKTDPPRFVDLSGLYDTHNVQTVGIDKYNELIVPFNYGMTSLNLDPRRPEIVKEYFGYFDEYINKSKDTYNYEEVLKTGINIIKWYCTEMAKSYELIGDKLQFEGYEFMTLFTNLRSSVGFRDIPEYDPSKLSMIIFFNAKENQFQVSMYSETDDVDVGKIAIKYGGGGHRGASGFRFKSFEIKDKDGQRFLTVKQ